MSRQSLIARLQKIEQAIDDQIENGSAYGLQGSHNKTNVPIEKLEAMAIRIKRKIAIMDGMKTFSIPDFR